MTTDLQTVGAMHQCKKGELYSTCIHCGAIAEKLNSPCPNYMRQVASHGQAPAQPAGAEDVRAVCDQVKGELAVLHDKFPETRPSPQATQQAPAGAADWWRPHASKIEDRVAASGSTAAMACFTDMRTLLQAATEQVAAPAAPSTPASPTIEGESK